MNAPAFGAQFRDGTVAAAEANRLDARVYNFPKKIHNLRLKIEAMRDEAQTLGFVEEAAQLAAMAVFAGCWFEPPVKRVRGWDAEQDARLRRLWLEGLTGSEIAEHLPKSRAAVLARARQLNLPRRARTGGRKRAV